MRYTYECSRGDCSKRFEASRPVDDRDKFLACPLCHAASTRVLFPRERGSVPNANTGRGSRIPGVCDTMDDGPPVYISNKHQLREECKKRNLTPAGLS